ncbi:MAG: hypothetical protein IJU91_07020 [Selenomonadaceae bacterium]|nr:hypothetical protein [Selenomonadaceae bacterium]
MALIGLRNFYYATMTTEDTATTAATYGTPKRIVGINSIDINPTVNKATLYGDDSALATASSLGEIEVTLDIADLPIEDLAALLGHTISDGVMVSKGSDSAPYVAIMFESEKHNGEIRYVKLLKGKFSESQETINTRGDSIEYQVPQITGTFVSRTNDSAWKHTRDTTNTSVATAWYASVDM